MTALFKSQKRPAIKTKIEQYIIRRLRKGCRWDQPLEDVWQCKRDCFGYMALIYDLFWFIALVYKPKHAQGCVTPRDKQGFWIWASSSLGGGWGTQYPRAAGENPVQFFALGSEYKTSTDQCFCRIREVASVEKQGFEEMLPVGSHTQTPLSCQGTIHILLPALPGDTALAANCFKTHPTTTLCKHTYKNG